MKNANIMRFKPGLLLFTFFVFLLPFQSFAQGTDFFGFPQKKETPPPKKKVVVPPSKPIVKPKPKPVAPVKKTVPVKKSVLDVLFLLDTSGSMDAFVSGAKQSKLDAAKQALNLIAKKMKPGTRFQLWSFNARLKMHPNSPASNPASKTVQFEKIGSSNSIVRKHLLKTIESLETRGGTNLYQTTYKALRYFKTSAYQVPKGTTRKKLIVILADGQDDGYSSIKLHHVLSEKNSQPDIQIRTIGFGVHKNDPLEQILCQIASSRKVCPIASDYETLKKIMKTFTGS